MFGDNEANQTNIGVVFGDVAATQNAGTTTTQGISVLIGKDPYVSMEITATISNIDGTSITIVPVVVSAFDDTTGAITFKHDTTGETRKIMYHVFYQNG
jgi:hypothetical protein